MSRVAAIGDGLNDIEMIQASGFGIAMGNAAPQLKLAADWVTLSQDEAGVSEAVRELSRRALV
jgi:5-amino-6-(5-phospho-D-ribitylamino)uracil phosphatase